MQVGNGIAVGEKQGTSLLPSLCWQAFGVSGADSSSAPQVGCRCAVAVHRGQGCCVCPVGFLIPSFLGSLEAAVWEGMVLGGGIGLHLRYSPITCAWVAGVTLWLCYGIGSAADLLSQEGNPAARIKGCQSSPQLGQEISLPAPPPKVNPWGWDAPRSRFQHCYLTVSCARCQLLQAGFDLGSLQPSAVTWAGQ